jgi:hypothetical protein
MKAFGVNEFAARFPNAFIGVLTLATIYYAGKRAVNEKMAAWWVALYAASWLPHFYFKSGIIDPTFNYFIFLGFFQFYLVGESEKKFLHSILAGIFIGLAVLTKGPVAILVAALSFIVFIIINRGFGKYKLSHLLVVALCAIGTLSIWFGIEIIHHGTWFLIEFIKYQVRLFSTEDSDHGGPFYYHFIVLLFGCFPASAFLFQYKFRRDKRTKNNFTTWMWILFWVVLILFSIVRTKIIHYSSLCYFPLTYLAALQIYRMDMEKIKISKIVKAVLFFTGSTIAVLIMVLPLVGIFKSKLMPYIDDPFAVGNLQADVHWSYLECLWGLAYLTGIIVTVILLNKNFKRGIIALSALQIVIIQASVLHFTPKVEAYSQRAAIDYFKSFEGKDVYVQVLGYKSYAYLFYTKKLPSANPNYYNEQWLLTGQIDKPTYFICKIQEGARYKAMPQIEEIGEKNGFVFLKRK